MWQTSIYLYFLIKTIFQVKPQQTRVYISINIVV